MDDKKVEDFFSSNTGLLKGVSAEEISPLNLAHLGDAVFELLIRTKVLKEGNISVDKLSKRARDYANAKAQSKFYGKIESLLTEQELQVLKRGRNAKSYSHAKNAGIGDYRRATGVEALFGFLYLKGRNARIMEIFSQIDDTEDSQ